MPSTEPEIPNCMKSSEHVDKVHDGLNKQKALICWLFPLELFSDSLLDLPFY